MTNSAHAYKTKIRRSSAVTLGVVRPSVASPDLLRAYETSSTYRTRTLAARNLWRSLPAEVKASSGEGHGHHGGHWLVENLGPIDTRLGRPQLTSAAWGYLFVLLSKEKATPTRPLQDVTRIWAWLDQREIAPAQLRGLFKRLKGFTGSGTHWDQALTLAKDRLGAKQPVDPSEVESQRARPGIEKTPQFQQIKRILEEAPAPQEIAVPDGYEPLTFRVAYSELLENLRVVQWVARHSFHRARRRHHPAILTAPMSAVYRACRTLRIASPATGMPADEFSARRKWLEVVKACHPDKTGGDTAKVRVYDDANKAFDTIREYNRRLREPTKNAKLVDPEAP